jgi:hypothetical protein
MKTKNNIKTLAQLVDEQYGKKGTPKGTLLTKDMKPLN